MKKMQLLHHYLVETGLIQPEQVKTTVTEGTVVFHAVGSPADDVAFLRQYTAQVAIDNYGGDADKIDAALVWWLGLYQPELAGDNHGYGFEAEIISTETVNLYALIPLTERVRYNRMTGEMINCTQPLVFDDSPLPAIPLFVVDDVTGVETEVSHDA